MVKSCLKLGIETTQKTDLNKKHITRRLRGILNAWHFQWDSALMFTVQWFRLGGGVVHPLTRRYA